MTTTAQVARAVTHAGAEACTTWLPSHGQHARGAINKRPGRPGRLQLTRGVVCTTDHSRLPRGRPVLAVMYASLHRRTGMPSPAAKHVTLSPSVEHEHSTACTNDTIKMWNGCSYLAGKDGDVSH